MRSSGNNFNYFPTNKLIKWANLVQLKRMLMFCLEDWGKGAGTPCLRHWLPLIMSRWRCHVSEGKGIGNYAGTVWPNALQENQDIYQTLITDTK